jgi:glycosyltransferase involved in cell wall biosynthesis
VSDLPRATIVVNNYNYGRFLAEAIDSALAQSHPKTEVVVVDDGSTDDSRQVMHGYHNQIVEVYKENGGQASAYNAGFAASHGDIICFLDSDDSLVESAIAEAASAFCERKIVKVEWQLRVVDARGIETGDLVPAKPLPEGDLRERSISDGPFYDWCFTPPSSGNCYSREFLEQAMPVPELPFRHGADVFLTILAPLYGQIHRLSAPQGAYRVHDSNNYFGRSLGPNRLKDYVQRFDDCCVELQKHVTAQGTNADIEDWKKRNFNYLWPTRWIRAVSQIESVVSAGNSYLLVNNDEWGSGEPVHGRHAVPFLENDGQYWGFPANDDEAVSELIRLKAKSGVSHIVFSWTAYWYFEQYPRFHAWLRKAHRCVVENDAVTVFDIRDGDKPTYDE